MGVWEKGRLIGEYRGVNSPTSWRQLARETGRDREYLRKWPRNCGLREKYYLGNLEI